MAAFITGFSLFNSTSPVKKSSLYTFRNLFFTSRIVSPFSERIFFIKPLAGSNCFRWLKFTSVGSNLSSKASSFFSSAIGSCFCTEVCFTGALEVVFFLAWVTIGNSVISSNGGRGTIPHLPSPCSTAS